MRNISAGMNYAATDPAVASCVENPCYALYKERAAADAPMFSTE